MVNRVKTRKQRELAQRHQLILDQSIELIHAEGISSVRMERLAQLTEYSKGTIYQHFTGREDLLLSVSNTSLDKQLTAIGAIDSLSLSLREKLIAIIFAYQIMNGQQRSQLELLKFVQSEECQSKASAATLSEHHSLYSKLVGSVYDVIHQAINTQKLQLKNNITADDIFGSVWAFAFGATFLNALSANKTQSLCPEVTEVGLIKLISTSFDALAWEPLSHQYDENALYEKVLILCKSIG
ncbi:hypothetical protein C9J12_14165 [Photobacterium frigidiphilum]|uniref:HTH tetR-type domain-containing protein n=1 Tax=Photobacterium frigidiphilum TaxID=264736 RepID=A0A2T3JFG7_9GAMM|nr:hypothetical protein C9J12_14165 [Photobacterium frigidiphilum]